MRDIILTKIRNIAGVHSGTEEILRKAMDYVEASQMNGDYFEFGVYNGASFIIACKESIKRKLPMKFFAFDSFKGLPESEGRFKKGDYTAPLKGFVNKLRKHKIPLSSVNIIAGFYEDSLKKPVKSDKASIIYLDCDIYNSTRQALDFSTNYIKDGTLLIFDEWFFNKGRKDKGVQKAFFEWLLKNPKFSYIQYQTFGFHGNSFILHKFI